MIEVTNCVICEKPITRLKKALVAPFVAARTWNRKPFCVDLVKCESCGFMFYNPRLDDDDLRNLYRGYRSEEFQKMRFATEPWYTPSFNYEIASPESYRERRELLAPILKKNLSGRPVKRILEYGGDRGDLAAGLLEGADAFSYDISGTAVAPGVTAAPDAAACRADLILNSNVLEHVGFPRVLVNEILKAAPVGGLIFLEVPAELPFGAYRLTRRIAQIGIMALTRPRTARYILRPAALYMMHMHINYFSEKSLKVLMQSCGGEVLATGVYPFGSRAGKADMAWCVARKI
jgi:hypothetical protein